MKPLIIANWKLNPLTLLEARELADKIQKPVSSEVVLCPPTLFLSRIDYPGVGAQDCFTHVKGPYTGQVSPASLYHLGVRYCLVGHSELRQLGQTDELVAEKIKVLIANHITPVLCVGFGTTIIEDEFEVIDVISGQLQVALKDIDPKQVVVAYEPVWAIGTGKPATPEHAEKIALFIQTKFGIKRVLYGGSVNAKNSKEFLEQHHIDGLLVGSSSLIPDEFNKIINI